MANIPFTQVGIALAVGVVLYIAWKIFIYFLVKGMTASGVVSRRTMLTTKAGTKKLKHMSLEIGAGRSDDEDEKADAETASLHGRKKSAVALVELSEHEKAGIKARSKTIGGIISSCGSIVILLIVLMQLMEAFGVDTSSLLTGAALVGLAFAFSVQTLIGDFVAGLFILLENQFVNGDLVEIEGDKGHVEHMSLRCTSIRLENGCLVTVPNGDIRRVANFNRNFNIAQIAVGVTYETDLGVARGVLEGAVAEAILKHDGIKDDLLGRPFVDGVEALGDSSVILMYHIRCKPNTHKDVEQVGMEIVKTVLGENGVDLAFPRQEIVLMGQGLAEIAGRLKEE